MAQMARAPRQASRMVLLLALASGFAIFTLIFTASQSQQVLRVAAYQVGADFNGSLPENTTGKATLAQQTAAYRILPGVTSATLGYTGSSLAIGNSQTITVEIKAVDSSTFAQTGYWSPDDPSQSLANLLAQLTRQARSFATEMPAVVDTLAWNALHLSVGSRFVLETASAQIPFIAIAEVQHIPTVNDSLDTGGTGDYRPPGGILIDFQTVADMYKVLTNNKLSTNHVWLRTTDDPALLKGIRTALSSGGLRLEQLSDRRAIIADLQSDPLSLALLGVLTLGALSAVLLALVGNLVASWLHARSRLTSFVVLRALGCVPRQIANVLLWWEQGIIYTWARQAHLQEMFFPVAYHKVS